MTNTITLQDAFDEAGNPEPCVYLSGDRFVGVPNARYIKVAELFQEKTSLVIDQNGIVCSVHQTPAEALKERDRVNLNWKVHFERVENFV